MRGSGQAEPRASHTVHQATSYVRSSPRTVLLPRWSRRPTPHSSTSDGPTWSWTARDESICYSVVVTVGTTSLAMAPSDIADGSHTRWWAFAPDGVTGDLRCHYPHLHQPQDHVWEFVVESRRSSPLLSNPFRLEAVIAR
ncbi:hypothetical protein AB0A81_24640 [Streptomyces flaveolus]|uniref:Uncharacterized protein n=1 Tax=Streptomyces flaveolus TaxID=67297 RepID=A0ABV1VJZ8_9ACTN